MSEYIRPKHYLTSRSTGDPESDSASVTVKAGEEISVELEGSACHGGSSRLPVSNPIDETPLAGGGSCQWSLSYDDMDTWIVIECERMDFSFNPIQVKADLRWLAMIGGVSASSTQRSRSAADGRDSVLSKVVAREEVKGRVSFNTGTILCSPLP